ncbi:MAG: hypothetical protein WC773_00225 [Patescibacteria group bacterium]
MTSDLEAIREAAGLPIPIADATSGFITNSDTTQGSGRAGGNA